MFFGAGAGKLPTASAIVADVVDCVKHKGKNVMTIWSSEKLSLGSADDEVRSFFVRASNDKENKVKEIFGDVDIIKAEGLDDEFGFITSEMTEKEFKEKSENVGIISRIRIDKTRI